MNINTDALYYMVELYIDKNTKIAKRYLLNVGAMSYAIQSSGKAKFDQGVIWYLRF